MLNTIPVNRPQCPFIQMTDTDVTFLSCYNIVGHARMHVMTLTTPPSLPLSRPWAGLSMRRPRSRTSRFKDRHSSHPYLNLSVSSGCMQKLTPERLHLSSHTAWILPVQPHHDPCLLSTLISLPPLQARVLPPSLALRLRVC